MKVLIIANCTPSVGGISWQVKLLCDNLLRGGGVETSIYSTKESFVKRIVLPIDLLFVGRKWNVFHIHCCSDRGFLPAVIGITVGRVLHKRIVLTYQGGGAESFFRRRTKIVRYFLTKTDTNIVLSGFLEKFLINMIFLA